MKLTISNALTYYIASVVFLSVIDSFNAIGILRHFDFIPLVILIYVTVVLKPASLRMFSIVFFILLTSAVWAVLNGNVWQASILNVLGYKYLFIIPVLFLCAMQGEGLERFLWMLVYIMVPICVLQRYFSLDHTGDDIVGFFGNGGSGILTIFLSGMAFSKIVSSLNWKNIILAVYSIIPILLNETKIFFVLILIYLMHLLVVGNARLGAKIGASVFAFASFIIVNIYLSSFYGQGLDVLFDPEFIDGYFNQEWEGDVGRYIKYLVFATYLSELEFYNVLFGQGIGSAFVGKSSGFVGVVAHELSFYRIFEGTKLAVLRVISDFGFFVFIFILFYFIRKLWLASKAQLTFLSILSGYFIIGFIVSLFYTDVLFSAMYMVIFIVVVLGKINYAYGYNK